ncbi:hypothetical protein MTO96_022810 [Rhipicephalus appendiculatus]
MASTCAIFACMLVASFVRHGSPCNYQLPPLGPRLLRSKALFGDVMRTCQNEIVEVAKSIPPTKLFKGQLSRKIPRSTAAANAIHKPILCSGLFVMHIQMEQPLAR